MQSWSRLSTAEQIAAYLRGELALGRWVGAMPGQIRLAAELGASRNAVEAALRQLEHEGLLVGRGAGRMRLVAPGDKTPSRPLRVAILGYEPLAQEGGIIVELQHLLTEAGHAAFFAEKSLVELGMEVPRIRRVVEGTEADAWVVVSGSREVIGWFAAQAVPVFALFGRRRGLPVAGGGPDKPSAFAAATRALIGLGHRRIVLLCRRERRLPEPGASERAFLDELKAHGIAVGPYQLPDWDPTIEGFHGCLESLFGLTPPTALIIDEAPFLVAAQQFLARRRMLVPEEVSLVCTDDDRTFAWCKPSVAHIRWDGGPVVRRIVRWAARVSRGKDDRRQTLTKAEFVAGGTIGPAGGGLGKVD